MNVSGCGRFRTADDPKHERRSAAWTTRASFLLLAATIISGCGSAGQAVVPGSGGSVSFAQQTQQSATTAHWRLFRLPSTGQLEKVYSWPQRDGNILAFGTTCCYPGGAPPAGEVDGITTTGTRVTVQNANPPTGSFPVESVPMPLFPCGQTQQICSIGKYYVYGPNGTNYYFRNQSAPDAVGGAANDVWFTVCCNGSYIVRGSNGSMHFYRTAHSLTDRAHAIARTRDGSIWISLQHSGSASWILARLNPVTSVVTEYPLQLPSSPAQLLVGPDGNIWFALHQTLYRVEATNAAVSRFTLPQPSTGYLASGANATIWTPYVNSIGAQGLMAVHATGAMLGTFACPASICARDALRDTIQQLIEGPDGNMWFAYSNTTLTNPGPPDDLYEGIGAYQP